MTRYLPTSCGKEGGIPGPTLDSLSVDVGPLPHAITDKRYLVKVKGYPPEPVWARNRSAAKYRAGKLMKEAGIVREPMTVAWHLVQWVRREDSDGDPRTPAYGVAP